MISVRKLAAWARYNTMVRLKRGRTENKDVRSSCATHVRQSCTVAKADKSSSVCTPVLNPTTWWSTKTGAGCSHRSSPKIECSITSTMVFKPLPGMPMISNGMASSGVDHGARSQLCRRRPVGKRGSLASFGVQAYRNAAQLIQWEFGIQTLPKSSPASTRICRRGQCTKCADTH